VNGAIIIMKTTHVPVKSKFKNKSEDKNKDRKRENEKR
jgi:hypothetical protein